MNRKQGIKRGASKFLGNEAGCPILKKLDMVPRKREASKELARGWDDMNEASIGSMSANRVGQPLLLE